MISTIPRFLLRAAALLYRLCSKTYRVRMLDSRGVAIDPATFAMDRVIYAISERDTLALACIGIGTGTIALVAEGRDGDWASVAAERLGYRVVRGSSLHEPVSAARRMIQELRACSAPAVVVVDGPVGPAGESKEGVAALASRTARHIVPASASASRRIEFRGAWSAMYFTLPFSTLGIAFGSSIEVPAGADRDRTRAAAAQVTEQLRWSRMRAEKMIGPHAATSEGATVS